MNFPIIKVRDNDCDREEIIVGSDHHHKLLVDKSGQLKFLNVQCMEGTGSKKEGYSLEFISKEGDWGYEVEFASIYDLIDIYARHLNLEEKEMGEEYQQAIKVLQSVFNKAEGIKTKAEIAFMGFVREAFAEEFGNGMPENAGISVL